MQIIAIMIPTIITILSKLHLEFLIISEITIIPNPRNNISKIQFGICLFKLIRTIIKITPIHNSNTSRAKQAFFIFSFIF